MAFGLSALNGNRSLMTAEWQVGEGCYSLPLIVIK